MRLGDAWPGGKLPQPDGPDIIIYPEPIESWAQKRRRVLWLADPYCVWCGFLFLDPDFATIEHLVPVSCGGKDALANTRLACSKCNERRGHWYQRTLLQLEHRRRLARARGKALVFKVDTF